jgi:hypothetical protein
VDNTSESRLNAKWRKFQTVTVTWFHPLQVTSLPSPFPVLFALRQINGKGYKKTCTN